MIDYSQKRKTELIADLDRMKTVTKSDVLEMLTNAYAMGVRESKEWYDERLRAEYVYDAFMLRNYGTTQKESSYYKKSNLPF